MKEMVGGCCVCSDDRGWAENPLVYCDGQGCTVAVHQACYGIVTVPSGNWYCRRCESTDRTKSACELCPSKEGAFKKTDNNGWAHVVCALYIPEVRFGNVTTMEPILLQHIPAERFNKTCYICDENGKGSRSTVGACMNCNKSGCKQQFHVTCAQALGLLCEEAGNYLDNVKYCGYCQHHYSKLKKGANVKTVPAYRPLSADSPPSPDKDSSDNWSKPGKRKLSTSAKSSSSNVSSGSKPSSGGKSSGTTSPAPTTAVAEPVAPPAEEPAPVPPPTTAPPATTTDTATASAGSDSAVNGKFTSSNFIESVVTPSGSVFGDSGKSGKKRKSQAKDENPVPVTVTSGNPVPPTEEKRLKIDSAPTPVKPEAPTPSVVVKVPATAPSASPPTTAPAAHANHPRQPVTTSPIAATSSIVVSVPLAVASLPTPPATGAPTAAPALDDHPGKRGRSQSADKSDKGRKQKRGGSATGSKRGGRSSQATPPPPAPATVSAPPVITSPTATAPVAAPTPVVMPVSQAVKDSPPSSPDNKQKPKKPPQSRDEKDKLFQNGVSAPHMLGNQLNPASTMAQKMSDTLSQELEAHSIFTSEPNLSSQPGGGLVGPQLHSRVIASVRGSGAGTPQTSSTPPTATWGGPNNNATAPQTLDQLLERQWEQGSQFLMEQAQHFDIASLLTCLHQLRAENLRLEEHVNSLLQRRDHLLAVNARLAIPLVPPPVAPPTVNNIHPAAANVPVSMAMDGGRPVNVAQQPRPNNTYPGAAVENGPTSPGQPYHPGQPNPISRHHSPGSTAQTYVCSAPGVVVRSTNVTSNPEPRRSGSQSSSHPQSSYPMYSVAATQQSQIVMRRDLPDHHHPSSKPS